MSQVLSPGIVTLSRRKSLENGVIKIRHLEVARKKEEFVNLTSGIIGGLTNVVEMSALQPE